ncbi:unnamed protein product [Rotaria socialis]|uniref:F-box domain-containing protein n=1 Tax=Rotaria socialis TaxID=392032 RepID=A0A821QH99_9BILA|nr:unnamed protein product [Rotaria socialis]
MMELESLPNEILLDLFEYFSIIQLLRDFNGLNFRLNQLLFVHASVYHLDFRSICRDDCKILCHQHLQAIIDRASSLRLSDDNDDNPQQINVLPEFNMDIIDISYKSTYLYNDNSGSCQQVRNFMYESSTSIDMTRSHIHFSNIRHFSVHLPFNEQFWTVFKNLNQLKSLSVSSTHDSTNECIFKGCLIKRHISIH